MSEVATTVTAPVPVDHQFSQYQVMQPTNPHGRPPLHQASVMEQISSIKAGHPQRDSSGSPYTDVVSTKPHTAPNITSVTANPEVSQLYE